MKKQKTKGLLMKNIFLIMSFLLLFASTALSRPVTDQYATVTDGDWGGTLGGEFDITVSGYNVDFIGFCLELNEYIYPDAPSKNTYRISSVVNYSENGGTAGQIIQNQDPLSAASKWVYWNYLNGTFGDRDNHFLANDVQRTIWALEEEDSLLIGDDYFNRDYFMDPSGDIHGDYGYSNFYSFWIGSRTPDDIYFNNIPGNYDIYVLNLMHGDDFIQSIIVGEPVPEPATMLLFGTGLLGLAGFARRRNKK